MNLGPGFGDFIRGEEGASVIEYAVLTALIAGAVVLIIGVLGLQVRKAFSDFTANFISHSGG